MRLSWAKHVTVGVVTSHCSWCILVKGKENIVVKGKENILVKGKENIVVKGKENIVVKRKENIVVKGKENFVVKGKGKEQHQHYENLSYVYLELRGGEVDGRVDGVEGGSSGG